MTPRPASHRAALLAALVAGALLAGCDRPPTDVYLGYAEADYVRLAAPIAGTLAQLHLERGDRAVAGAPAFGLEQDSERAEREEAASRLRRAEAQWADLLQGRRPDELAAIRAQRAQARAALTLSRADLARGEQLVAQDFVSPAGLDQLRAGVGRDVARVGELDAQLRVARLGGREQEIAAAAQEVEAARAALAQAEWKVAQKTQLSPVAGDVVDVLYREGEWVAAGSPVVTLLPPEHVKARFFVPPAVAGGLALGQAVQLSCDGCGAPIPARVSFIAREAEYTAPLIFSREIRAKLVFMIEARPTLADARRLHPGLPVEARLAPAVAAGSAS
jgi:HlyD family secretion protein